jgi:hypothetical protein
MHLNTAPPDPDFAMFTDNLAGHGQATPGWPQVPASAACPCVMPASNDGRPPLPDREPD